MSKKKAHHHHIYYGTIKATTEHWYGLSEYLGHCDIELGTLTPTISIIRRYTRDGRMTQMENFGVGELEYITEYTFNANGQIISSLDKDPAGNLTRKSFNIYNKDGLIEECRAYSDKVNLDFRMLFSYDSQGKRISETTIHKNHNDNSTTFFEYNDDNTITRMIKDDKGKSMGKTIEKYDSAGNLISFRDYDESGRIDHEEFYTYDIQNNELTVKMKHYSAEGIEYTCRDYEYIYDHMDNWVKVIQHAGDDEYQSVCIREIEYY